MCECVRDGKLWNPIIFHSICLFQSRKRDKNEQNAVINCVHHQANMRSSDVFDSQANASMCKQISVERVTVYLSSLKSHKSSQANKQQKKKTKINKAHLCFVCLCLSQSLLLLVHLFLRHLIRNEFSEIDVWTPDWLNRVWPMQTIPMYKRIAWIHFNYPSHSLTTLTNTHAVLRYRNW